MNVSSVTNTLAQHTVSNQNRAEGRIEGNKPDRDGDQDDAVRVATTKQTGSASPGTDSLGNQIDMTA